MGHVVRWYDVVVRGFPERLWSRCTLIVYGKHGAGAQARHPAHELDRLYQMPIMRHGRERNIVCEVVGIELVSLRLGHDSGETAERYFSDMIYIHISAIPV